MTPGPPTLLRSSLTESVMSYVHILIIPTPIITLHHLCFNNVALTCHVSLGLPFTKLFSLKSDDALYLPIPAAIFLYSDLILLNCDVETETNRLLKNIFRSFSFIFTPI